MKTLFSFIDQFTEALGILCTCALIIVAFVQVFWRYVLGNALSWPEELSLMLFLWMSYIGVSMAMKKEAHLRVDAFIMLMPKRIQHLLHLVCLGGSIAICGVIARLSFDTAMKIMSRGQTAISFDLPIWVVWIGIPLCFALTTLQAGRRFWQTFRNRED